jgi:hypothetical protein
MEENRPQEMQPVQHSVSPLQGYGAAIVIAVLALCVGLMGYAYHERSQAARAAAQNQQISASLAVTQSQIAALTEKIGQMTAAEQERQAAAQRSVQARRSVSARSRRRADDPRWKQMQSQLEDTRQQINDTRQQVEATRNDLNGAKSELGGAIARNHDELVTLQRKGERNFFEFDIVKTKQFRPSGSVAIKLKKANVKHQYADLQLMVDDAQLDKKHVNLYEPVVFLNTDSGQPVQLVIQSISKDHIHGYVSEPKYRASELASGGAQSAPQPPERKRLTAPQE